MSKAKVPRLSFSTSRLLVRPLGKHDFKEWKRAAENLLPKQSDFDEPFFARSELGYPRFLTLVNQLKRSAEQGLTYQLFAFDKTDSHLIGSVQCALIQRYDVQKAYLGYNILNNYWRMGYGYELAHAMIEHAFKSFKLHRLEAEVLPSNIVSIKLSKKLGMTYEGTRRRCLYVNGEWRDHKVFAVTAEDQGIQNMKPSRAFQ